MRPFRKTGESLRGRREVVPDQLNASPMQLLWALTASHAFLWSNGVLTDLNTWIPAQSGWQLLEALEVYVRGQIVAGAFDGTVAAASPSADVAPSLSENARRLLSLAGRAKCARYSPM